MTKPVHFTDDKFESEVLGSDQPVLVDFWAEWCGPCRLLTPTIEELASELGESAKVGKLNVDENPATAAKYRISSIPSVLVFRDGELVETLVGVQSKQQYRDALLQITV
jgi:thioredoxin 1